MKADRIPEDLRNQYEKASMAVDTRNYAYAVDLLTHLIKIRPDFSRARQLLRLADSYGKQTDEGVLIDFKMSQRELAAYVGLARENINRQLRAWEKEELISRAAGAVTIVDLETMRDIAELDE